jgi:sugar phosphate isomerase/epimerase
VVEGANSWKLGLQRLAPWIRSIDIKDFIWAKNEKDKWAHVNVPLGEGMVNFDEFLKEYAKLKVEAPVSIHYEYDLGGAELGKNETTMEPAKIYELMRKDLVWLRETMKRNKIEA